MTDTRALKRVTAARAALEKAQRDYPEALKVALEAHSRQEVAQAAGVTPSAMYKTLRKTYGPRKSVGSSGPL